MQSWCSVAIDRSCQLLVGDRGDGSVPTSGVNLVMVDHRRELSKLSA